MATNLKGSSFEEIREKIIEILDAD